MRRTATIASVLLALSLAGAPAAFAADAARGAELARRWCAACHLVAPDQQPVPTVAPPFGAIGKKPGFTARSLAQSLQAPHPVMPERGLSREESEDIAAFIGTLR